MNHKPIIFNTQMVKAILNNSKTQTRRIVNPNLLTNLEWLEDDPNHLYVEDEYGDWNHLLKYAPVNKGDLLWVRETFSKDPNDSFISYRADYDESFWCRFLWKPSIFLPKKHARIWLKVTDVRVHRIKRISKHDAIEEGVKPCMHYPSIYYFEKLWDSINKDRGYGWDKNPYVWAYTFKKVERQC
ncbi:MAG: hypothetical protein GY760_13950 [Deltaproteobacteria bacterium]|nr:hypothetical protein [Deltaproteobacteria bacterium]